MQALSVIAQLAGATVPAVAQELSLIPAAAQQQDTLRASSLRAQEEAVKNLQTKDIVAGIRKLLDSCQKMGFTCLTDDDRTILAMKILGALTPDHVDAFNQRSEQVHGVLFPDEAFVPIEASRIATLSAFSANSNFFISGKPGQGILVARSASEEALAEMENAAPDDIRAKAKAQRTFETVAHELGHGLSATSTVPMQLHSIADLSLFKRRGENASDIIKFAAVSSEFGASMGHYSLSKTATNRLRLSVHDPDHAMGTNMRKPSGELVDYFNGKGLEPNTLREIAAAADQVVSNHFETEINSSPYPEGPQKKGYDTALNLDPEKIVILIKDRAARLAYIHASGMSVQEIEGFENGLNQVRSSLDFIRSIEPDQIPDLSPRDDR